MEYYILITKAFSSFFIYLRILLGYMAWSPSYDSLDHSLTVEFSERMKVYSISTQGHSATLECITEYYIQYSDNGQGWKNVEDFRGEIEV